MSWLHWRLDAMIGFHLLTYGSFLFRCTVPSSSLQLLSTTFQGAPNQHWESEPVLYFLQLNVCVCMLNLAAIKLESRAKSFSNWADSGWTILSSKGSDSSSSPSIMLRLCWIMSSIYSITNAANCGSLTMRLQRLWIPTLPVIHTKQWKWSAPHPLASVVAKYELHSLNIPPSSLLIIM